MSVVEWLPKLDLDSWTIAEGVVEPTPGEGGPRVRVGTGLVVHCDVLLDGSGSAPVLEPGDRVLLTVSRDDPPSGVVLGKIVTGRPAGTRFPVVGEASPAKRWLASADVSEETSAVFR